MDGPGPRPPSPGPEDISRFTDRYFVKSRAAVERFGDVIIARAQELTI